MVSFPFPFRFVFSLVVVVGVVGVGVGVGVEVGVGVGVVNVGLWADVSCVGGCRTTKARDFEGLGGPEDKQALDRRDRGGDDGVDA